jgi:hypothetical protein
VRLRRIHPVVVRAGVVLVFRADEGQVFDAGHVGGVGTVQIAVRMRARIELDQVAALQHQVDQRVVLGLGAVAPVHALGLRRTRDVVNPLVEGFQLAHCSPSGSPGLNVKIWRTICAVRCSGPLARESLCDGNGWRGQREAMCALHCSTGTS